MDNLEQLRSTNGDEHILHAKTESNGGVFFNPIGTFLNAWDSTQRVRTEDLDDSQTPREKHETSSNCPTHRSPLIPPKDSDSSEDEPLTRRRKLDI